MVRHPIMLMSGRLRPDRGDKGGCLFEVIQEDILDDENVHVKLISPFSHAQIVDEARLRIDEVGRWLADRSDY